MSFNKKRQFIAGAICPRCSEMDKVVVYNEDGKDYRECVSCGFKDEMHFQKQTRELETRVNQSEQLKNSQTQVLQFPPLDKDS